MDCETCNKLPVVEQSKCLFSALQTSMIKLFAKIVCKVNLKLLTILEKRSNLDASLGSECVPAAGYNIIPKIQTEITYWQQIKMELF